ncbi:hypothetical protein EYZ11_010939 [Aspergillus tanneri]|uniref:Xylose isomerase-like TIM barrel domain-containing protein n=1 Tax=Aspergillus tanneri TaxID=1220188 RepID=A0A4S3J685_9EURO|nr:uncharacterized protein ATNIH1004_005367 [Aspergillus tanneri]KAA8646692.1 hypothetical protein ATNIH1004_005367 [Aspergillus tanneri]THC89607.1 hypothetical protein EYZ11_010939 [Aspergillus tanneri]
MSLGRAWAHQLPEKLKQASIHGFKGVEIFYEDLEYLARDLSHGSDASPEGLLLAARTARHLCDQNNLTVVCLQPFLSYEGLLDPVEHRKRIEKLKLWFQIIKILGTDMIQIPANFMTKDITGDLDVIVADMVEVAELGLRETPSVRFVYENISFATYVDTWEMAWDVVQKVDRPNFGICLDTFNICARVYGDPAVESGKTLNAERDMQASIERMKQQIDVKRVFYVQIVDGERLRDPITPAHPFYIKGQSARMGWSRNARLFAYEEGGYLPILDVARVIFGDLGFEGWVSLELFSRTMARVDPAVPRELARRGYESWRKLKQDLHLKDEPGATDCVLLPQGA